MRAPPESEKVVPSAKTIATLASGAVAITSPWWTAAPGSSATSTPSTRVAVTLPAS
jgi:hypothetical protein